jgi:DamX protein
MSAETLESDRTPPASSGHDRLTRLAAQSDSDRIDSLAANLEQHWAEFQNAEVALITRIADVDDDLRLAASRLQRTWQSNRDEMVKRLKRQGLIMAIILLLFGILITGSLAFFQVRFEHARQTLVDDVSELRHTVKQLQIQIPDSAIQSQVTQEKLSQLSLAIKSTSASLERFSEIIQAPASVTNANAPVVGANWPTTIQKEAPLTTAVETPARASNAVDFSALPKNAGAPPIAASTPSGDPSLMLGVESGPDATAALDSGISAPDNGSSDKQGALAASDSVRVGETPYSLQLIGFFSLEDLQRFVRLSPLPPKVYYREDKYRGRPWFVLIHSLYASSELANAAIASLPADLAKLDLWVRKLDPNSTVTSLSVAKD